MIRHMLIALALLGSTTLLKAADWKQQAGSTLSFKGQQQGETFDGQFRKFNANIHFDPAALADAKFDVEIDITSADSANSERDETMLCSEFFDSKKFPKAHFVTKAFRLIAPGQYEADAVLTIRDKSVALKFPFTWSGNAMSAELKSKVTLDRLAFDVGTGDWEDASSVGHQVEVIVHLKLAP
jgi:polyisoprenoid-binding protein YceI